MNTLTQDHKLNIDISSLINTETNPFLKLSAPTLNKLLKLDKLNRIYDDMPKNLSCESFIDAVLDKLDIQLDFDETELKHIPLTGPVMIVANHPFGAIDGLILLRLIKKIRPDAKIMANQFLSQLKEISNDCIFVDAFNKGNDKNRHPIKRCIKHLSSGGLLAVFPAGSVSHYHPRDGRVSDDEWNPAIFRMAKMTGATVISTYFKGKNSLLFNTMGLIHPAMRTALLPRELTRVGQKVTIKMGTPIKPTSLKRFNDNKKGIDFLRLQTLLLGTQMKAHPVNSSNVDQAPIIEAVPKDRLKLDLAKLPQEAVLHTYKEFDLICASSDQLPNILKEIGRLREITFRRAGEGTGNSIDLDDYDKSYEHLFMWNRETQEIAGAYRLGRVDQILKHQGKQGLYTSRFYKYSHDFLNKHRMGLELGRSFIRAEYQRKPYSLLLLWRGIGAFMIRHKQYRYLSGAVSVSNDYSVISRAIISETLLSSKSQVPTKEKSELFKLSKEVKRFCRRLDINTPDELSSIVRNFETDGKDIPPLIKHYMKMGGEFCSFSVDKNFGGTLDGLIIVDLPQAPKKSLQSFLGINQQNYIASHS